MKSRLHTIALLLIVLASLSVYANILQNDFVYDDTTEVISNPWIRDFKNIPEFFLSNSCKFEFPSYSTSNYYHPLKLITYTIQYSIFNKKPWGYHLTSALMHMLTTILVFFIAISLYKQSRNEVNIIFPLLAALFFAVHPIHTEAVAFISATGELFMAFFCLASFLIYINAQRRNATIQFIVSAVLFLMGALFKATAITFLFMFFLFDYAFKQGIFAGHRNRPGGMIFLRRYLPFICAVFTYVVLRSYAIGGFVPERRHAEMNAIQLLMNIVTLFGQYLQKLIVPQNLNVLEVFHPVSSLLSTRVLYALLILFLFIVIGYVAKKNDKGVFLSLFWIVIPLLPVLYFPAFLSESVFAERYLYLPSAGLAVAVGYLLHSAFSLRLPKFLSTFLLPFMVSSVLLLFSLQTINRNHIWKNDYSLWTDTLKNSPDSCTAHNNLGNVYYRAGYLDQALKEYQIAVTLNPNYQDALNNYFLVYRIREALMNQKQKRVF